MQTKPLKLYYLVSIQKRKFSGRDIFVHESPWSAVCKQKQARNSFIGNTFFFGIRTGICQDVPIRTIFHRPTGAKTELIRDQISRKKLLSFENWFLVSGWDVEITALNGHEGPWGPFLFPETNLCNISTRTMKRENPLWIIM